MLFANVIRTLFKEQYGLLKSELPFKGFALKYS